MRLGQAHPSSSRVATLVKWLWLAAVVPSLALLLYKYRVVLLDQLRALEPGLILASLGALLAAKGFLSFGSWLALAAQGKGLSFGSVLTMVSISQLGKYAPGAVVHLLGRGWLYSRVGVPLEATTRALILENVWQWMAAALVGALFLATIDLGSGRFHSDAFLRVSAIAGIGALGWLVVNGLIRRRLVPSRDRLNMIKWASLASLSTAWVLCGLSLYAIWPGPHSIAGFCLATGAFAIASVAGFLAPFAPAGLGVREAVLVAVTAPVLSVDQALGLAAISRGIWIVGEVLLAGVAWQLARLRASGASP